MINITWLLVTGRQIKQNINNLGINSVSHPQKSFKFLNLSYQSWWLIQFYINGLILQFGYGFVIHFAT